MTTAAYDVFLSYARADAAQALVVRNALTGLGLSVFFDAEGIDSGEEFPAIIDRAVKGAKCVLGLWSRNAFTGRWVRIESRIGLDQNKLVAVTIDGMRPEELPAEFYNVNVVSLTDFTGDAPHDGWARTLRAIGKRVGRADLTGAPAPKVASSPSLPRLRRPHYLAVAGAIGALAVTFAVVNGASPTHETAARNASVTGAVADVSGLWSGGYTEAGRETRFDLDLRRDGDGGAFTGSVSEPDIYGIAGGQSFTANITGQMLPNGAVRFTKTYRGNGASMRAVVYEGRIAPDGRSIAGTWDTGALHGPFYMDRR